MSPERRAPSAATSAPGDRPQPPVERELADRGVARERLGRQLVGGGEHGERDRQVEARPLLAQRGRREVDGDAPLRRPLELGRGDPAADALLRLLAGAVGEADDRERRQPLLEVRLDLDPARVEADERVSDRACEHVATLGAARVTCLCRLRAESVNSAAAQVRAVRRRDEAVARQETPVHDAGDDPRAADDERHSQTQNGCVLCDHASSVPTETRSPRFRAAIVTESLLPCDQDVFEVLARAAAGAPVHVALVALLEPRPARSRISG